MSQIKINSIANVAGSASTDVLNVINGSAKAWVNFNGTGTVAIRAGYNVSSITDNAAGDYTANFTNALADANYSAVASATQQGTATHGFLAAYAAGSVRIQTQRSGVGAYDESIVSVAVFR